MQGGMRKHPARFFYFKPHTLVSAIIRKTRTF